MDIKFIYNFVFKLIFELIQSKELKTYYDVFFYEPIDSIQKKKKKANKHTKQRQSNKAQQKQLSCSDWLHSSYSSCAHRPYTNLQKIALKIPTCSRYQSIKSSQTSLGLAIKQFFHLYYRERKKRVKSAYKLAVKIINSSMQGKSSSAWRDKRMWRKLWKLHVPSEVKHCVLTCVAWML